jgi:hypothetical protein
MRIARHLAVVALGFAAVVAACSSDESTGATPGTGAGTSTGSGAPGGAGQGGSGATGGSGLAGGAGQGGAGAAASIALPPANAQLDYQLGGAYPPPANVQVLSRDRNDAPAPGLYNICYVNGYQAQPDEDDWWLTQHPDLVLRDGNGDPVIDPDWDEMLLDVSTAPKRAALAAIVGGWIAQCASDGFAAVEIDNLDTYSRSQGLLTEDNAVAFMKLLSDSAHASGLAIAQKNSTEILSRRAEMGTDFAVAEECNRYSECGDYVTVYGDLVFVIEYRQQDFSQGCADHADLSIVLRDLNLVTPSSSGYVYDAC